jgi:ornithine cyclodeaminase
MRIVSAAEVHAALDYPALIGGIRDLFRAGCEMPPRQHLGIAVPGAPQATLLVMPAWQPGVSLGVKLVSVFPGNGAKGLPAVMGQYVLLDATTGAPRALIDGMALTVRRTAATSALAASYLARADAATLLMVGTGAMAPELIAAHCSQRPIKRVLVWGRRAAEAQRVAGAVALPGVAAKAVPGNDRAALAAAVAEADIVSSATLSAEPLVLGAWLRPGQHLDLVGGYTQAMREADDDAVRRARVYVDTRAAATKEAGDIVQPLKSGALKPDAIAGDLYDLTRGTAQGRRDAAEITFFKSVGAALEDLAAATLVASRVGA